jgi:ABC-type uncharacterized transport system permease subunit
MGFLSSLSNVTLFCFLASYAVALGLEGVRFVRRWTVNRFLMVAFAVAGLVAHTIYLVERSRAADLPPLLSSSHDWLLVLAWLTVLFYIVLTAADPNLVVGPFLLPLTLVFITASAFVSDSPNTMLAAARGWKMLHATLLVLGIAGVSVGFVLGLMYLVQHYRLRHKRAMANGLTLPNLERLGRLNWWAVVLSVPLLTLGIGTGVGLIFAADAEQPRLALTDPVVVGNGVAWLVMVLFFTWLLATRRPLGKQVAWMTIWACGFLLVAIIGLQLLSGRFLDTRHIQTPRPPLHVAGE